MAQAPAENRLPVYFLGHAGVGLLFRESEENKIVQGNLRDLGEEIRRLRPKPKAIIVFSGHFEAGEIHGPGVIEVNVKKHSHIQHDFVNDFHDSHPFVYEYDWPHLDAPEVGQAVFEHLRQSGFKVKRVERGVDHGVWVPFKLAFPEGAALDVPIVQVSTFNGYDLHSQIRLGQAFQKFRDEGYLIVGSGMAVHSFASIGEIHAASAQERGAVREQVLRESEKFDASIRAAIAHVSEDDRTTALLRLESLAEFKRSHPTVEVGHFTPLLVAAGAAGNAKATPIGQSVIEPGMSYLNLRFDPI